jgi:hypothetical protein
MEHFTARPRLPMSSILMCVVSFQVLRRLVLKFSIEKTFQTENETDSRYFA